MLRLIPCLTMGLILVSCTRQPSSQISTIGGTCLAPDRCSSPAVLVVGIREGSPEVTLGSGLIVRTENGTLRLLTAGHVVNNGMDAWLALPTRHPRLDQRTASRWQADLLAGYRSGSYADYVLPVIRYFDGIDRPGDDAGIDFALAELPPIWQSAVAEERVLALPMRFDLRPEELSQLIQQRPGGETFSIVSGGINDTCGQAGYLCVSHIDHQQLRPAMTSRGSPARIVDMDTAADHQVSIRNGALLLDDSLLGDRLSGQPVRLSGGDSGAALIMSDNDADYVVAIYHGNFRETTRTFSVPGALPGVRNQNELENRMEVVWRAPDPCL